MVTIILSIKYPLYVGISGRTLFAPTLIVTKVEISILFLNIATDN